MIDILFDITGKKWLVLNATLHGMGGEPLRFCLLISETIVSWGTVLPKILTALNDGKKTPKSNGALLEPSLRQNGICLRQPSTPKSLLGLNNSLPNGYLNCPATILRNNLPYSPLKSSCSF